MTEVLVGNIYVGLGGQLFRQTVDIPMGTNCALLLVNLFLYSSLRRTKESLLESSASHMVTLMALSLSVIKDLRSSFLIFSSKELTISETTEFTSVASYLDLLFTRDKNNNVTTKLYDKRDAFVFHIVNFPFMSGSIPSAPTYGVYASQLIHYARCCSNYSDFLSRHRTLVTRLLSEGYKVNSCPTHSGNSMADALI